MPSSSHFYKFTEIAVTVRYKILPLTVLRE